MLMFMEPLSIIITPIDFIYYPHLQLVIAILRGFNENSSSILLKSLAPLFATLSNLKPTNLIYLLRFLISLVLNLALIYFINDNFIAFNHFITLNLFIALLKV